MQRGVVCYDTPDGGVWIRPKEQRIVLDTREVIQEIRNHCNMYGEISAIDLDDRDEMEMFMSDLFNQCEYYPAGYTNEHLSKTINVCLDNFQEHVSYPFTSMQRYLWLQVAIEMVSQSFQFGLRDTCFVSRFTFDRMMGDSVVLRPYE